MSLGHLKSLGGTIVAYLGGVAQKSLYRKCLGMMCGVCWGCGGVGCCRVGSLLTFDIPQTALVATLDTYDFIHIANL
jgi:hypothetical protein